MQHFKDSQQVQHEQTQLTVLYIQQWLSHLLSQCHSQQRTSSCARLLQNTKNVIFLKAIPQAWLFTRKGQQCILFCSGSTSLHNPHHVTLVHRHAPSTCTSLSTQCTLIQPRHCTRQRGQFISQLTLRKTASQENAPSLTIFAFCLPHHRSCLSGKIRNARCESSQLRAARRSFTGGHVMRKFRSIRLESGQPGCGEIPLRGEDGFYPVPPLPIRAALSTGTVHSCQADLGCQTLYLLLFTCICASPYSLLCIVLQH